MPNVVDQYALSKSIQLTICKKYASVNCNLRKTKINI